MDYGILMAIGEDETFQVVGIASTEDEAAEKAAGYMKYGPNSDCLAPARFELHRNYNGIYNRITEIKPEAPAPVTTRNHSLGVARR
jgi:hypothetical protein